MKSRGIPGLAVGVVRNGEVVKLQGYGYADLTAKSPVTTRTAFQLASLTKQFVAAGVMLLVSDGKLKVDDPLGKAVIDEMYTKVRLADGKVQDYGHGMVVNVVGRHRIVGHGGGRPGAGANFTRWLDDGITVAVLANTKLEGNGSYELARGVARRFVANLP